MLVLMLALIVWGVIIVPVYSFKYSKIVKNEKSRLSYAFYNTFVMSGIVIWVAILTIEDISLTFGYCLVIFLWILFWNILTMKLQPETDDDENELVKEKISLRSLSKSIIPILEQIDIKNKIAICLMLPYLISLVKTITSWELHSIYSVLTSTLPMFSAFSFVVYLFIENRDYSLRKWLIPFGVAGELIGSAASFFVGLGTIEWSLQNYNLYFVNIIFSCLIIIVLAVMLMGAIFDFKYKNLFKYSALACGIISVILLIFNLINVGGVAYYKMGEYGERGMFFPVVITSMKQILYFAGINIVAWKGNPKSHCDDGFQL